MLNQFNHEAIESNEENSIEKIYNELLKEFNLQDKSGNIQPATTIKAINAPLLFQTTMRERGDRFILPRPPNKVIILTENDRLDNRVLREIDRITSPKPRPQRVYGALEISSTVFYESRRRLTEKGYINGEPWYKITEKGKQHLAQLKSSEENINPIYNPYQKN